ncbi:MAG: hypothetical protein II103_09155 [Treponema sp.]|nr:hypothetical protein [Treponema sp.]MBQ1644683.1 hypothetical protein [Treponema sp.]MBQ1670384.1 hypothetical protein [Treponema sp.]MBQ1713807.1 hypothetical protein [Treponema sp.]MBQ1727067.1 hypothetical protein [Treponema sp.]
MVPWGCVNSHYSRKNDCVGKVSVYVVLGNVGKG